MRKSIFKLIAVLFALFTLVGLSSCSMSKANVYNNWKNGSSEYLSKDHVVEKISVNDLINKVNKQTKDDKNIFVFFGQTNDDSSRSAIKIYNEQAIQYEIETLYWVDSESVTKSTSDKNKMLEKLGVSKTDIIPAIFVFTNGTIAFDSSRPNIQNNEKLSNSNVFLAEVAFKGLYDENGYYAA